MCYLNKILKIIKMCNCDSFCWFVFLVILFFGELWFFGLYLVGFSDKLVL